MYSPNNYIYSHNKYLIIKPDKQSLFRNSETRSLLSLKSIEYRIWHSINWVLNIPHKKFFKFAIHCVNPRGFFSTSDYCNFHHEYLQTFQDFKSCRIFPETVFLQVLEPYKFQDHNNNTFALFCSTLLCFVLLSLASLSLPSVSLA